MVNALIVVDVQNDFCDRGSLAVPGGARVAADISRHLVRVRYDHVVATRDRHVDPGPHFSDRPDYVDSWPAHCVEGTIGADFHPDLDQDGIEAIFDKGRFTAAYSGFEAATTDEAGRDVVTLARWLGDRDVEEVTVVGLATDYCVRATALDSVALGLHTSVDLTLSAGVAAASTRSALEDFRLAGIVLGAFPV